jgi:hypothetical protein
VKILALLSLTMAVGTTQTVQNRLTADEQAAGWRLLFDGQSLDGWRAPSGEAAGLSSWTVVDGCLKAVTGGLHVADLWTHDEYRDFDFRFEWRTPQGGNSGVRYLIQDWARGRFRSSHLIDRLGHGTLPDSSLGPDERLVEYSLGLEYQVADDEGPRTPNLNRASGSLYALLPVVKLAGRPTGEWNSGRLLIRGNHVEHWLNGIKVVTYELDSKELKDALLKEVARQGNELMVNPKRRESPITLQHHLTEFWFRNLKVRRLEPGNH